MTETTRLLRDLVALPSVNPMGRDLDPAITLEHRVTAYLEDYFRSLGVPHERQTVAPRRDNIVARWQPADAPGTLVLEVHQDTVPVDGMTIDPFGAKIENGRLFGRGACDVKGGMAAMLAAFARLVREKPRGAWAVVMACTVDEEHTFQGVQRLAKDALNLTPGKPVHAVVAEPTQLEIVNAHKGAVRWHLTTAGRSCHSSRPEQGVNAIYRMAEVLVGIQNYAAHLRETKTDPVLGPATLSVGRIDGGVSPNTVPDRCVIEIDRRVLPGEDPLQASAQLTAYLRDVAGVTVPLECSEPWLSAPALGSDLSADLVARLGRAIDAVVGSHRVTAVPYGTDASTLAEAGVPAVVFGPGDIAQAHTRDESVPLDEVERASEILYRMACEE